MKKSPYNPKVKVFLYILLTVLVTISATIVIMMSSDTLRYSRFVQPKTKEVSPDDAYKYMSNNPDGYMFIDVRSVGEYNNLHALSSINMPIASLFEAWKVLPRSEDKKIYLICTSGRLASIAYGYLQLHGFTNIEHIEGGMKNWIEKGLPVNVGNNKVNPNFSLDIPINLVNNASSSLNR